MIMVIEGTFVKGQEEVESMLIKLLGPGLIKV